MHANQQLSRYRPDIDGLRAIAVVAVITFHAFPAIAPGGFVGVDVFFVISGYLISRIIFIGLHAGKFSFSLFYAHRIKRIFPALIVLLAGCLAIGWFIMTPGEYLRLGYHITASSLFVENVTLWHETGYFDVEAELKPLLHLWSLSVEEQFYLFYPLLIWAAWKIRFNLLTVMMLLAMLSLTINIRNYTQHPDYVFYLLHTRFWELLAGGIIAYLHLYKKTLLFNSATPNKKNIFPNLFAIAGLLLIIYVAVAKHETTPDILLIKWIAAIIGTCLLVSADANTWINKHLLANRPMVYIGLISYPLYLWHWSLLSFLRLLQPDHIAQSTQKIFAIALSFVLAWATYQWIEKPFRYGKNSNMKLAILIGLLIIISLLGIGLVVQKGWPSRYPSQVSAIATYTYDQKSYARYGRCWIDRETPATQFSSQCLGALASPTSKQTVLVWGDSHAAHMYPAIDAALGGKGQVAEFARSTCAPVLGAGNQDCISGNEYVMAVIRKHVPETVILFSFWNSYADRWNAESPIAIQLLDTVHALQAAGVKNILLMGPAPQWGDEVPNLVLDETLDDAPQYRIPQRLNHSFNPISNVVDADLQNLVAHEKGLTYFSTLNSLCNMDGCLVRTLADPVSLTTYDYAHFTIYGAEHVAKQLPGFLFH